MSPRRTDQAALRAIWTRQQAERARDEAARAKRRLILSVIAAAVGVPLAVALILIAHTGYAFVGIVVFLSAIAILRASPAVIRQLFRTRPDARE